MMSCLWRRIVSRMSRLRRPRRTSVCMSELEISGFAKPHRGRRTPLCHYSAIGAVAGSQEADPPPGARERSASPCCGVSLPCQSAGKITYPLVRALAADGVPVTVTHRVLKVAR